ncbi:hypothetical protein TKK_0008377 [Trichogramma kaykai]
MNFYTVPYDYSYAYRDYLINVKCGGINLSKVSELLPDSGENCDSIKVEKVTRTLRPKRFKQKDEGQDDEADDEMDDNDETDDDDEDYDPRPHPAKRIVDMFVKRPQGQTKEQEKNTREITTDHSNIASDVSNDSDIESLPPKRRCLSNCSPENKKTLVYLNNEQIAQLLEQSDEELKVYCRPRTKRTKCSSIVRDPQNKKPVGYFGLPFDDEVEVRVNPTQNVAINTAPRQAKKKKEIIELEKKNNCFTKYPALAQGFR